MLCSIVKKNFDSSYITAVINIFKLIKIYMDTCNVSDDKFIHVSH